jgi:hypothetical protein
MALLVVSLVWPLPWAMLAAKLPRYAAIVIAALAPLAVLTLASGAGRAEPGRAERLNRA